MDKFILKPKKEYPNFNNKSIYYDKDVLVNETLQEIFRKGKITLEDGEVIKLTSNVSIKEGFYMYNLIKDNKFKRCLEIGMANGISALYICQALKENNLTDSSLTSIDPNQKTQWKSAAVNNIRKAGLSDYSILLEMKSYNALPELLKLLEKKEIEPFDCIFIDGMHLFDYTLIDFFYSDLLLRNGGVILLDDIKHSGSKVFYDYAIKNYKQYKLINTISSDKMATFLKIKDDNREWNFHRDFNGNL